MNETNNNMEIDGDLSLSSLPQDALISVLCRVPSSDHVSLRNTCKSIRSAIDSDAYKSERASTDWAEVSARLIPGEELYDREHPDGPEDDDVSYDTSESDVDEYDEEEKAESLTKRKAAYRKKRWEEKCKEHKEEYMKEFYSKIGHHDSSYGWDDITIDVKVDGHVVGEISMVLMPRPWYGRMFYEASDMHSGELAQIGTALCDNRGRPAVRSIKEADIDRKAECGGFLHIQTVRIPAAYRAGDTSNVVSRAVRGALTVPELKGKWTLATAMCDIRTYMSEKEMGRRREIAREDGYSREMGGNSEAPTDALEQAEEKKRIINRWNECMMLDARTFLRVGYKQIPEVVGVDKEQPPWLFALPRFLEKPVFSEDAAAAMEIIVPPDLPPEPTGIDQELLNLVKTACNGRRQAMYAIAATERTLDSVEEIVRREDVAIQNLINQIEESESQLVKEVKKAEQDLDEKESSLEAVWEETIEQKRSRLRGKEDESKYQEIEDKLAMLEKSREDIPEYRERIKSMKENTRATMEAVREEVKPITSKLESSTFEERCTEKKNEINRACEAMRDKMLKRNEDVKAEVIALVKKGGSVRKSFVLHCSARFHLKEWIDTLLDMVPKNDRTIAINSLDMNGCTPLHCALSETPTMSNADKYYSTVVHLIQQLKADTNVVDPFGRTPLGKYRITVREGSVYDWARPENEIADAPRLALFHKRMEGALKPTKGETDADRDAKGDDDESSEEDDEDFDDDDDDDDDDNGDEEMMNAQ